MSFEITTGNPLRRYDCLAGDANEALCIALTHGTRNGVSMVAAAGNFANFTFADQQKPPPNNVPHPELYSLPVTHPDVLAVSGLQFNGSAMSFWEGTTSWSLGPKFGSNFGRVISGVPEISFAAPAAKVLASVYPDRSWATTPVGFGCGDQENVPGSAANDGIGLCTGTSMAAPHVSAMAGLVKSANPLLDTAGVKAILRQSADCLGTGVQCTNVAQMEKLGYGVPKADKAVGLAIGGPTAKNRVTPLYAYYNTDGDNHFYTTNPQMAVAAARNTLQPAPRYRIYPPYVDCAASPAKCQTAGYVDEVFTTRLPD